MAADPISRLEVVRREIDRVFGDGHAAAHQFCFGRRLRHLAGVFNKEL
jgi:hypothetical protein